jgi:hypothetical protein
MRSSTVRNALRNEPFAAVALAPHEIDCAYPLVAAVEGPHLSRAGWRAIAGAWIGSNGERAPRRGILTLRARNGTLHALFFFELREDDGARVLEVSRLRVVEVAGAHQALSETLGAIDRWAAACGCQGVRIAMDDAGVLGRGIDWAVLHQFAERDYRPRSALLFRWGTGDEKVVPLRRQ